MSNDINRYLHVDIAKAIGMVMIIWGHVRLSGMSHAYVYAFHIPLFFFLSGLFFNRNKYAGSFSFFKKKSKSLLLPYFVFSILFWGIWTLFIFLLNVKVKNYWYPLLQTFISQGSDGYMDHDVPLWFIPCLFVMEYIYYFLSKWGATVGVVLSIIVCAISILLLSICPSLKLLPWSTEVAMIGIPFFSFGNLVVHHWGHHKMNQWVESNKITSLSVIIVIACLISSIVSYNGNISYGHVDLGKSLVLTYLEGFLGIIMVYTFCILSAIYLQSCQGFLKQISHFLSWFGRNSFVAMAVHCPIKNIVAVLVGILFNCPARKVGYISSSAMVCFVLTFVLTILTIWGINTMKRRFEDRSNLSINAK